MRAYQFLLVEYDQAKTIQNFGQKMLVVARRDNTIPAGFRDPKEVTDQDLLNMVITTIEQSDPTRNKEYVQAMAKLYSKGGIRFEDLGSTVAEYLTKFHKLKQKRMIPSPRNDFMGYADIGDFYSVVDEYPNPEEKAQTDKGQAKAYYEDAEIRVIVPEDQTAACYYGQGTRWCTAGRTGNMFNHYSQQGPLYVVIPKKPKLAQGEKYQFHFESAQFMDTTDTPISLKYLVANYPSLRTAFSKQAEQFGEIDLMTPEQARPYVERNKKQFISISKNLGNGIRSVNVEDYQNEVTGFNDAAARVVRAVTGKDLQNNAGLNISYAGDHAWALVSTNTGEVRVVYTDMEGAEVHHDLNFNFEQAAVPAKDENLSIAADELQNKLRRYIELNDANGEWGDEEDEESDEEIVDDQEFLDNIFDQYGAPANRRANY
jgi:hypothetical protein